MDGVGRGSVGPPGRAATGRKVPRKRAERPSGACARARETCRDAPCDPRVRAAPARPRTPPVRRGRPAVGHRARLVPAHRPLPRVRRGGPDGRRPALAAHRRRRRSSGRRSASPARRRVERAERDVEFVVLRRRLRILLAPEAAGAAPGAGSRGHGRRTAGTAADDGSDLGAATGSPVGRGDRRRHDHGGPRARGPRDRARSSPSPRSRTRSGSAARTS